MTSKEAAALRRELAELREEVDRLRNELACRPSVPQYIPAPTMPPIPWPKGPVLAGTSAEPLPQVPRVWCGSIDLTGGCAGAGAMAISVIPFSGGTP